MQKASMDVAFLPLNLLIKFDQKSYHQVSQLLDFGFSQVSLKNFQNNFSKERIERILFSMIPLK